MSKGQEREEDLPPSPGAEIFCLQKAPAKGRESWNEVAGFANYMVPDIWETSFKRDLKWHSEILLPKSEQKVSWVFIQYQKLTFPTE